MADENQPEPKQRVRYNIAVTVDGVTHPANTHEVDVTESDAKTLEATGRAKRVRQQAAPVLAPAPQPAPQPAATAPQGAAATQPQPAPAAAPATPTA